MFLYCWTAGHWAYCGLGGNKGYQTAIRKWGPECWTPRDIDQGSIHEVSDRHTCLVYLKCVYMHGTLFSFLIGQTGKGGTWRKCADVYFQTGIYSWQECAIGTTWLEPPSDGDGTTGLDFAGVGAQYQPKPAYSPLRSELLTHRPAHFREDSVAETTGVGNEDEVKQDLKDDRRASIDEIWNNIN